MRDGQRCRVRRKEAGFTLLEVLVALSALGMVLILLTQGVQFGVQAIAMQSDTRDRHSDLEAVDRALRRMVALADPGIFPEPPTMRGTARVLAFTTELPLGGAGPRQNADVAISAEAGRLLLRWTPRRHVEPFGAAPVPVETVLLQGVDAVEFAYGRAGAWSSSWRADRLPALVRVRIIFPAGSPRRWPPIVAAPLREVAEE